MVDYRQAAVPERFYYADYCDVQRARSGFGLLFGKLVAGTSKLRTKIEIDFPQEMFVKQLWASTKDFYKVVQTIAEKMHFPTVADVEDTDKVQTFRANNVFIGAWGEEAVMDFYYISPREMHYAQFQQRVDAGLEPVIRVLMSTGLLFEFLEKCRHHIESLPEIQVSPMEVR
ncbi:MAG: hypothetical protein ABSH01_02235 [Terriglobia bacterium]|jgi:hypothetical protein